MQATMKKRTGRKVSVISRIHGVSFRYDNLMVCS